MVLGKRLVECLVCHSLFGQRGKEKKKEYNVITAMAFVLRPNMEAHYMWERNSVGKLLGK
jgi:hypothetical protein